MEHGRVVVYIHEHMYMCDTMLCMHLHLPSNVYGMEEKHIYIYVYMYEYIYTYIYKTHSATYVYIHVCICRLTSRILLVVTLTFILI